MLVLSRKLDEAIMIGDNVVLRVIEINGDRVKLGLTAPTAVSIMRSELVTANTKKKSKNGLERQTPGRPKHSI
jgi:carbon storage regulator